MNTAVRVAAAIIDGVGAYMTREGLEVAIYDIKKNGATFNCHGYLLTPSRLERVRTKREWNIWSPDGHFVAVGKHKNDITRKIS